MNVLLVYMLDQSARKVLNLGLDSLPNRAKWELMNLVPGPYLNITDAETESEFRESGKQDASIILEKISESSDIEDVSHLSGIEVGTGPGRILIPIAQEVDQMAGVDVSAANLKNAKDRVSKFDLSVNLEISESNLPFEDSVFDFAYSVHVFQHMPRRTMIKYLYETLRVLSPGGVVYYSFANICDDTNISTLHDEGLNKNYSFRMRYYGSDELKQHFKEAGFCDIQIIEDTDLAFNHDGHQLIVSARKPKSM